MYSCIGGGGEVFVVVVVVIVVVVFVECTLKKLFAHKLTFSPHCTREGVVAAMIAVVYYGRVLLVVMKKKKTIKKIEENREKVAECSTVFALKLAEVLISQVHCRSMMGGFLFGHANNMFRRLSRNHQIS